MERNELLSRQDAQEQKRKLDCLLLKGPVIPNPDDVCESKTKFTISVLLAKRAGINCDVEDIDFATIKTEHVVTSAKDQEEKHPIAPKVGIIIQIIKLIIKLNK